MGRAWRRWPWPPRWCSAPAAVRATSTSRTTTTPCFIKIPDDWDVVSEGAVNFTITPDDDIQPIPGEFVLAWRAEFDAAPASRAGSFDYVQGYVEVQPVDRRWQSQRAGRPVLPRHRQRSRSGGSGCATTS